MKKLFLLSFFLVFACSEEKSNTSKIEYVNSIQHKQKEYPFSEATIVNDIVYVSGQIGSLSDDTIIEGGIANETIQSLKNIESVLKSIGGSKNDIFKCTCMLKSIEDWPAMSKAYKTFFDKDKLPSRSAFAGSGLAKGALVEIECLAINR
ncbi:MAG: 2-iminobutanoate/2-iminopropanoate deaminase [Flavobacterium sp. SCGC AAA160-P02]|nr:MAG: 2-iminobutanoate/2-iminopropanoate deaminase [Flavobacterium sp. SCGC AAA160-P02]